MKETMAMNSQSTKNDLEPSYSGTHEEQQSLPKTGGPMIQIKEEDPEEISPSSLQADTAQTSTDQDAACSPSSLPHRLGNQMQTSRHSHADSELENTSQTNVEEVGEDHNSEEEKSLGRMGYPIYKYYIMKQDSEGKVSPQSADVTQSSTNQGIVCSNGNLHQSLGNQREISSPPHADSELENTSHTNVEAFQDNIMADLNPDPFLALDVPFVTNGNRRGGSVLTYRGYRYCRNNSSQSRIYWRCARSTCGETIITNRFDINHANPEIRIQRRPLGEHSHAPDDNQIRRRQFIDEAAALLRHDPTLTIRKAYNIVFDRGYHRPPEIPTFPEIRSQLQRVRMALCPPIPRQITDVEIDGAWAESWNGQRRLLLLDNQAGVAVFATDEELIAMQDSDILYFDGTIRTTPRPYSQIVTIHGLYRNTQWIIPLGMALLGGKTQAHYELMLQSLKEGVLAATGRRLTPGQTMTDFEAALMQAIRAEFPETRPYGCYFHFCSSLYRKIQDLGLQEQYRWDEQLKNCARKLMSIGYLPVAHVRDSFDNLRTDPMTEGLFAQYPALQQFFAYFEDTYLIGNSFPPETWNVHDRDMISHTNDAVESFHSRWNMEVGGVHPSLWAIIRRMKKEGKRTEASLDKALHGDRPPKIKRKWKQLQEKISGLRTSLQDGRHNLAEFWAAVVHATHDFL